MNVRLRRTLFCAPLAAMAAMAVMGAMLAACQKPADRPAETADLILTNADVVTVDASQPSARAVAIRGESIVAVGDMAQMNALRGPATRVVDLNGRTVVPGFIDAHQYRLQKFGQVGLPSAAASVKAALAQGWTTLDELYADPPILAALTELDRAGQLSIRINVYLPFMLYDAAGTRLGDWYKVYHQGQRLSPHVRVAGLIGFADFDNAKVLLFSQDELNATLLQATRDGWSVALKTVSTRSLEMIIKAYEYVDKVQPGVVNRRNRLEHALFIAPDQIPRIKRLGLVPVINLNNPGQLVGESDVDALIAREPQGSYTPWRSLEQAGIAVANGTGWPSYYVDEPTGAPFGSPVHLIYQAVTRIGNHGAKPYPWLLDQTITATQALREMTLVSAYASFEDSVKGSIAPGKLADLVVLSGNPAQVPADQINNLEVLMTLVGGQVLWCAPAGTALCSGSSSPTVTASAPADPFLGVWTAVDPSDGSQMRMQITRSGTGFRVVMVDDKASACGRDSAGQPLYAAEINAVGTTSGNVLTVPVTTLTCLTSPRTSKHVSVTLSYAYEVSTDTLVNASETWQRTP